MKPQHWLLTGVGCIGSSILVGVVVGLYWMGIVRSLQDGSGTFDPLQGLGVFIVVAAFSKLLFFGGLVALIVGFIKLSKEPSSVLK